MAFSISAAQLSAWYCTVFGNPSNPAMSCHGASVRAGKGFSSGRATMKFGSSFDRSSAAAADAQRAAGPQATTAVQHGGIGRTRKVSSVISPSVPAEPASKRVRS